MLDGELIIMIVEPGSTPLENFGLAHGLTSAYYTARPRGQALRMPERMRRATRPVAHVWLPSLTTFNFLLKYIYMIMKEFVLQV